MSVRKIIKIDEEKCDGCGLCTGGCAEGALEVIDGKARLVSDVYCDGLGACLGECPQGALSVIEREAPEFDEEAVRKYLAQKEKPQPAPLQSIGEALPCGCPSSQVRELTPSADADAAGPAPASALRNWPVQLELVPPKAPFFENAELLIAADCTGFALTNLHQGLLKDKALIIACPKLDDVGSYQGKLAQIFKENNIKGLTVLYMTVPCCFGLVHLVRQALDQSGRSIPLRLVKVDLNGQIVQETLEQAA